jgi:hypothetical protein
MKRLVFSRRVFSRLNTSSSNFNRPDDKRVQEIIAEANSAVNQQHVNQQPVNQQPTNPAPNTQPQVTYNIIMSPSKPDNQPVIQDERKKKNKLTTEDEFKVVKKWMPMITMIFGSALKVIMEVISKRK